MIRKAPKRENLMIASPKKQADLNFIDNKVVSCIRGKYFPILSTQTNVAANGYPVKLF
jgi:hypothetical protein